MGQGRGLRGAWEAVVETEVRAPNIDPDGPPTCPHCDTTQAPEYLGKREYFCPGCAKKFHIQKGL